MNLEALSTHGQRDESLNRRRTERETTMLRIGVISSESCTSFCVLRNVSENGIQVKLYDLMPRGEEVIIRVGDGEPVIGRIVWMKDRHAGIRLYNPLGAAGLLRMREHLDDRRRRAIPRVSASALAVIRSGGLTMSAKLHNISSIGAKLSASRCVSVGTQLHLRLPDLPELRAYACWNEGETFGVRFQTPLSVDQLAVWLSSRNRVPDDGWLDAASCTATNAEVLKTGRVISNER